MPRYCEGRSKVNGIVERIASGNVRTWDVRTWDVRTWNVEPGIQNLEFRSKIAEIGIPPISHSDFSVLTSHYSYRNASTGSSFEAFMAGTMPLITPTITSTIVESTTVISDICR
jgi:hypothetical protein